MIHRNEFIMRCFSLLGEFIIRGLTVYIVVSLSKSQCCTMTICAGFGCTECSGGQRRGDESGRFWSVQRNSGGCL